MTPQKKQDDRGKQAGGRQDKGDMSVREAGQKGGEIGGQKGGQRVRELVEEGKQTEGRGSSRK